MHLTIAGLLATFCLFACVAGYDDSKCEARRGKCQPTSSPCSGGNYVRYLCGGPSNRRCCIRSGGYDDSKCEARRGKCQPTSSPCSGGNYVRHLCGGPSNRRCCIRSGGGGGGCSPQQRQLACDLFRDSNIRAAKSHPSGQRDNAYAYNNLRDMCNGDMASRSSYRCNAECHAPGGSTCLSLNLLKYLVKLKSTGTVIINELAGACHSCWSRHYSGLAVDLHKDRRTEEYIIECRNENGRPIHERNHVHCQFTDGRHPNW